MRVTEPYATLKNDSIDIWITPIEHYQDQIPQYEQTLNKEESQRAQRYHFDKDRYNFILSRGRLRKLIEHYLEIPANTIHLTKNEYDKPFINDTHHHNPKLYFNVSHSHNMVIHAFGLCPSLGIDIEHMKDTRSLDQLAERCYTENEIQYYKDSSNRVETFYKLWSHKEAYLKAIGTGLSTSLKNFEINLSNNSESRISEKVLFDPTQQWYATDLRLFEDYQAALVTNTRINHLNVIHNELDNLSSY